MGTNSAKAIATSQKQTSAQPPLSFSWWAWNRVSLGQFWPAVPTVSSPSFLLIPGLLAGAGRGGKMKPWCCASNAQQKPKHRSCHKSKAKQHHKGCCEESYLSPCQTLYSKKAVFFLSFYCSFDISVMWFTSCLSFHRGVSLSTFSSLQVWCDKQRAPLCPQSNCTFPFILYTLNHLPCCLLSVKQMYSIEGVCVIFCPHF